ncbi:unnamed protein product [Chrysodeixis includens]|uniref:Insulin-like domain-containing protein n=1 Tax=Chrysodeixis includens TaxID=689277 RepID=A0A9N8L2D5_CHRIL|nr:unnamed protein product [Chrysodeixis includens]
MLKDVCSRSLSSLIFHICTGNLQVIDLPSERISKVRARRAALLFKERLKRQVADECCENACSVSQLIQYCPDTCDTLQLTVMNFIVKPLYNHAKLLMLLSFVLAILLTGVFLRTKNTQSQITDLDDIQELEDSTEYESMINSSATEPTKTRRKEYLYRLLTNTTRSLIQMEIKARRLEENMRRIKEKTADLLWKDKDKALWHILFKNISRHISIRHEFHQHASLRRIMQDSNTHTHNRKAGRRKLLLRRR